ncbi:hypothetical protein BpHYR1_051340, partial [Brachionus plicatilis]
MLSKKQIKNPFSRKSGDNQSSILPDINEKFIEACESGDLNT